MLQAFLIDKMSTYMLICNAWQYRLVLYTPGDNLWCSDTHMLPLATGSTPEGLAPQLEKVVRVLAYALTQQMDWLDTGLGDVPKQLVQAPPEASGGQACMWPRSVLSLVAMYSMCEPQGFSWVRVEVHTVLSQQLQSKHYYWGTHLQHGQAVVHSQLQVMPSPTYLPVHKHF